MFRDMTMPCSVPTRNLAGPASMLYSRALPPSTLPPSLSTSSSVGSLSLRVSHHSMRPSVDTETNWLLVLDWIQKTSYTGSKWDLGGGGEGGGCV